METFSVLEDPALNPKTASAESLLIFNKGRLSRFTLLPRQRIKTHKAPQALLSFDPGEEHAISAMGEDLVFLAFLHDSANVE
jgi:hypothetical protein